MPRRIVQSILAHVAAGLLAVATMVGFMNGCSDPAVSVLPAGTKVDLRNLDRAHVSVWVAKSDATTSGSVDVPADTRAVVVEDREAKPPVQDPLRLVKARITDGPRKGLECEVSRYQVTWAP